jgi:hypothetical protein
VLPYHGKGSKRGYNKKNKEFKSNVRCAMGNMKTAHSIHVSCPATAGFVLQQSVLVTALHQNSGQAKEATNFVSYPGCHLIGTLLDGNGKARHEFLTESTKKVTYNC